MKRKEAVENKTEKEASVHINEEVEKLIKELAILSVVENVKAQDVKALFSKERKEYLESMICIPEETDEEKKFREKANSFFDEFVLGQLPAVFDWRLNDEQRREYIIKNGKEIIVAAYKLFKQESDINADNIYRIAKEMLARKPTKTARGRGDSWGTTMDCIRKYLKNVYPYVAEQQLTQSQRYGECWDFLKQFEYRNGAEETMLKLLFLIN